MPPAIAAAVAAAEITGPAALAVETVANVALAVGLAYGAQLLLAPEEEKPSDGQQEIRQALPARFFHYGRVKISGPVAFYEDDGDRYLYKATILSHGELDAIEQLYLNDDAVTLDTDGAVQEDKFFVDGGGFQVYLNLHLGTDSQTADDLLTANFPDLWTSEHRLRGVAYVVGRFRTPSSDKFNTVYTNGEPTVSAIVRGARLYDPRPAYGQDVDDPTTWLWSDNAGLAVLHYLLSADGYGRAAATIDFDTFADFADLCDELVPLLSGQYEPRYRVATTVGLDEAKKDVLGRLLAACDARLYLTPGGLVGIRGGEWIDPVVVLDDATTYGPIIRASLQLGTSSLDRYNTAAVRFLSPELGFVEADADDYTNDAMLTADGGAESRQSLDYPQVPSYTQARRLAKIRQRRENPDWQGSLDTNFYGVNCIGEALAWVTISEIGLSGLAVNLLSGMEFRLDGTGMTIPFSSADWTSYEWNYLTEEGTAPSIPNDPGIVTSLGGSGGVGAATITWTAPDSDDFNAARVWRAPSGASFGKALPIGTRIEGSPEEGMSYADAPAAGTWDYWVVSENFNGARSYPVGPATIVVT